MTHFDEDHLNHCGEVQIKLCRGIRINITYFNHKVSHNFVLRNRSFDPSQLLAVRSRKSANVGRTYLLVLCRTRLSIKRKKKLTADFIAYLESITDKTQQKNFTKSHFHIKSKVTQLTKMTAWKNLGKSCGQISQMKFQKH